MTFGRRVLYGLVSALVAVIDALWPQRPSHPPVTAPESKLPDFDPGAALRQGIERDWHIHYMDRQGRKSRRRITVKSVHGEDYPRYIRAFCHLRHDNRFFAVAAISQAQDIATGLSVPLGSALLPWLDLTAYDQNALSRDSVRIAPIRLAILLDDEDEVFDATLEEVVTLPEDGVAVVYRRLSPDIGPEETETMPLYCIHTLYTLPPGPQYRIADVEAYVEEQRLRAILAEIAVR